MLAPALLHIYRTMALNSVHWFYVEIILTLLNRVVAVQRCMPIIHCSIIYFSTIILSPMTMALYYPHFIVIEFLFIHYLLYSHHFHYYL